MKYYSKEIQKAGYIYQTAGVKARDDVEKILAGEGYEELLIPSIEDDRKKINKIKKLAVHFRIRKIWKKETQKIGKNDILIVQFPVLEHCIFLSSVFRDLRKKGVKIYFLIHDLDYLRLAVSDNEDMTRRKSKRLQVEQKALHFGNRIIVHNDAMLEKMTELGFNKRKLISLQIFDYLIPDYDEAKMAERKNEKDLPIIIAGNLMKAKAEYVYNLPRTSEFNLFGVNYDDEAKENVHYMGAFMPDELPYKLDGSFGLVWDGNTPETCSGGYGEYMRINNPHKTSLYLASGIPILIWSKAALKNFVVNNNAGIAIDSLYDVPDVLAGITEEDYKKLKKGAETVSEKLRSGYFTKRAVSLCETK